jgi:hypothetical protein
VLTIPRNAHHDPAMRVCGSGDGHRRRLPCQSGKSVYWPAAPPNGHATTFAAARWRRAYRGLGRGTSSCRFDADNGDRGVGYLGHGVLLVFGAPSQHSMPVGQEHGRTIPLPDIRHPFKYTAFDRPRCLPSDGSGPLHCRKTILGGGHAAVGICWCCWWCGCCVAADGTDALVLRSSRFDARV